MVAINNFLSKENLSSILVWIYCIIAPYISSYMTQDQFITIGIGFIGFMMAIYSSYNPNTMLNTEETQETE